MTLSTLKKAAILSALLLAFSGCGKEEAPPVNEDSAAEVQESIEATGDESAATAVEDTEEAVVVVEESAAEPKASDESAILLARADTPATASTYKYKEGTNYVRLVPSQPTIGGADKIEVAEFFWYGCPHCYDLEPTLNAWAANVPPNVRFVRVPAMWNQVVKTHAQLYYTEEALARNGAIKDDAAFRQAVFEEYHRRGNRLLSEDAIEKLFTRYGVSSEDFHKTWSSFEVAQKLLRAEDLARRYSIASVPAIVVNGKYRTSAAEAGSFPKLIEVINELIDRESTE
ncbi:MAG TPA: thiol:disulfide interchange protein DsbA/DsbL [Woeseiaceae bacterium]|nr:thiol:disulfide interchange protein DsbA/DsbL [Woeseiaceae bacterium]